MTTIPEGASVSFSCTHRGTVLDETGNAIEMGNAPIPTETFGPGEAVPDYWLLPPDGLTIVGDPVTVTTPTRLSQLLEPGMGLVHWAACRSVR